jgi:hypothetical protein
MFNPQKIESIRQKIQTSTLLTDHEKADWLNLLELMNDKQLGELEEILGTSARVAMPPQPASKMPPLTHLANIPSDITLTQPPQPSPPPRPPQPPRAPAPAPARVPAPGARPPAQPRPTPTPTPTPPEPLARPVPKSPFELNKLEEIAQLTVETLREVDLQSFVNTIRSAIMQHGYFNILQLLEQSPLYDAYIQSGSHRLKTTAPPEKSHLTQEEFEFMADLLQHMRFNRW